MPCEFPHDFKTWQLVALALIYLLAYFGGMGTLAMLWKSPTLEERPNVLPTPLCPDERPHSVEPSEQPAGTAHV